MLIRLVCLITIVTTTACSSDEDGGPLTEVAEDDAAEFISSVLCRLWTLECGCDRNFFGTFDQCKSAAIPFQEDQFQQARDAGLTYDPTCGAELVNLLNNEISCNLRSEIEADALQTFNRPNCKLYFGTGVEGDECISFSQAYGDTCAQGLMCLGTCTALPEPRPIKAVGETCDPATEACELGSLCQAPETDPTGPTSCVQLPAEGEPCTVGCAVGAFCDRDAGVCKPPPPIGDPCNLTQLTAPQCAAGAYCERGVEDLCVAATPEGTACSDFDECGAGFECREPADGDQDLCLPEEPLICI